MSGATHALAAFVTQTPATSIPPEVLEIARRAVLDTIGVALAGSLEPAARIVTDYVRAQAGEPESVVWGTSLVASAQHAALANGTAGHVLDFDDTNDSMRGHPSVTVLPAVFAMAERVDASGMDLLVAFTLGVEVACKLGSFTGQRPYDHGWHVTAMHGVVGATAGTGRLADLSADELQNAIGIAVSMTGGVRGNFGTMTKSLHVGRAAQSAMVAVDLAQRGFTASDDAIEGRFGYWAVLGQDAHFTDEDIDSVLGHPFDLASPGLNVKPYPCCASTHAAIDAVLSLDSELSAADIERVVIEIPYTAPLILIHHRPQDPLSAKFSLEYCVAVALLDGEVTLQQFTTERVCQADVQGLLRRVEFIVPTEWREDRGTVQTGFARVDVYCRDETMYHAETAGVRGSPALPLTDDELESKFLTCARLVIDDDHARELVTVLGGLEQLDSIRRVSELLTRRL